MAAWQLGLLLTLVYCLLSRIQSSIFLLQGKIGERHYEFQL